MSDLERIRTERVLGRRPPVTDPLVAAVRGVWAEAVGEAVARNTAPARLSGGAVVVACSSASWSAELALLAPAVAERLREALGREVELRFEVGDVSAPDEPQARVAAAPAPGAAAEARRLASEVSDAGLRESLERAIARTLRG
jgi:predicted nucleic acid-binding Zn ribbon protein